MEVKAMEERLARWARAHVGGDAGVTGVRELPGHSGISFAFDLGADATVDRLVIRIPPAGVRRSGITDVLRQVPLLQLMEREAVPVPSVRWWGDDERWFGVPYLIVDLVPGATLGDVFAATPDVEDAEPLFRQAVEALAGIHAADWRAALRDWDAPRALAGEVERYAPLLAKSPERDWIARGEGLARRLAESVPPEPAPGVVHNDFYSNNWMFDSGRLTGVLDWEGTFVGAPLLDLGWVCMMYDPPSWSPAHRERIRWSPPVDFIAGAYEAAAGTEPSGLDWYRAFAGYRLSSLTAYYLDLHRRGRRPDAIWENLAESVPVMLERAAELAG
jgi:aminoglycoside phosphotransferase (APT) family kinase protein